MFSREIHKTPSKSNKQPTYITKANYRLILSNTTKRSVYYVSGSLQPKDSIGFESYEETAVMFLQLFKHNHKFMIIMLAVIIKL